LRDFVCYSEAEKLENKIAEQKLDNDVVFKIKKIEGYHKLIIALEFKRISRFVFYSR